MDWCNIWLKHIQYILNDYRLLQILLINQTVFQVFVPQRRIQLSVGSLRGRLAWQTELRVQFGRLLAAVCLLRHEHSLVSEHAQYAHPVGGARLWGHDFELRPPLSGARADSSRRWPRRSLRMCPLPAGEEEEELGVEPVLRPGGVHRRRAAVRREGTNNNNNYNQNWESVLTWFWLHTSSFFLNFTLTFI